MWCKFKNQTWKVDSVAACFFHKLPYLLAQYDFEWVTMAFLIPVLIISIFSDIKASYRWFILNSTIWDIFVLYHVHCDKPIFNSLVDYKTTCFYASPQYWDTELWKELVNTTFLTISRNGVYSPLLLLTASRFLCIYFNRLYTKIVKPLVLVFIIFGSQVLLIVLVRLFKFCETSNKIFLILVCSIFPLQVSFTSWIESIKINIQYTKTDECYDTFFNATKKLNHCLDAVWKTYQVTEADYALDYKITIMVPFFTLLITDILALLIIYKIITQWKFQIFHNRTNFISSIKITAIIAFQCITLTSIFSIIAINAIQNYIFISVPQWFSEITYGDSIEWFNVCRAFCDSIFILIFLPEYRIRCFHPFKKCLPKFLQSKSQIEATI